MKVLILHNDNLPEAFHTISFADCDITREVIRASVDDNNYDSFVSGRLEAIFASGTFDLIVLPYTFGECDYMEYSGLRVAMHIRLTEKWQHSRKPLLFAGPDPREQVAKFSDLGEILLSSYVFTTLKSDEKSLQKIFDYFKKNLEAPEMSAEQYSRFLNRVCVTAPANYGTHHSIANEWAILRWLEMLNWPGDKPEIKKNDFPDMLYFKFLMTKAGQRENYNRKKCKNSKIDGIGGKKIVYIDDEYHKGWQTLLEEIFKISGAELICYTDFNPGWGKQQLIEHINAYVDKQNADCYLLDLRLHETDFDCAPRDISGHRIAEHIKKMNKGNQIVIFTASDKVWNLKEDIFKIGPTGYVIKESPGFKYTREDSYKAYCDFLNTIKKATEQSYIREYVELLDKANIKSHLLDSAIDLLLLDKSSTHRSVALNLIVFLESYLKEKFKLEGNKLLNRKDLKQEGSFNITEYTVFNKDFSKVDFVSKPKTGQIVADPEKDLTQIIIPLKYYYQLSDELCNLVVRLKHERNTTIAHHGGEMQLSLRDLKEIFSKVIKSILTKDYPVG